MASSKSPDAIALAFIQGTDSKVRYASLFADDSDTVLMSYGEHFPVIIKGSTTLADGRFEMNAIFINLEGNDGPGYSRTTDRHVRSAHNMAAKAGYAATGREVEIGRHVYAVYVQD